MQGMIASERDSLLIFEGYDLLYDIIVTLLAKSAEEAARLLITGGGVGFTGLGEDSLPNWLSDYSPFRITSHSNHMVPGVTDFPT